MIFSYLKNGALIPQDFAVKLEAWYVGFEFFKPGPKTKTLFLRNRCNHGLVCLHRLPRDIGSKFIQSFHVYSYFMPNMTDTVRAVVFSESFLSDPSGTAFAFWDEQGRVGAANGSLMRTAPVGVVCLDRTEDETFEMAINMGAVTHADPRCAISVAVVSALIRGLCREEIKSVTDIDGVLERAWAYMKRTRQGYPLQRDEFDNHVHVSSLESLVLHSQGMGYVYKCLGSALWCLREVVSGRETFKSAIVKLVMCAGDADTNSTVAGALIGAWCGYDALPPEWRDGMRHQEWYLEKISAVFVVAGYVEGSYEPEKDPDIKLREREIFLTASERSSKK
jgi:hypothetical protein